MPVLLDVCWEAIPLSGRSGCWSEGGTVGDRRNPGRETHGRVIADLNFGFWRFLCEASHHTSIWVPCLAVVFPGHPSSDDALFGPDGSAFVFVEAKRHGNLSPDAESQLFEYANNKGIPLLVLTDGDTWNLYLSMAAGQPAERRFMHIQITATGDLDAVASDLERFLLRTEVISGKAYEAALRRMSDLKNRQKGKSGLQAAWSALLREPDEMLRDLLIERIERDSGSRPWSQDAEDFLRRQVGPKSVASPKPVPAEPAAWLAAVPAVLSTQQRNQIQHWLADPEPPIRPNPPVPKNPKSTSGSGNLRGFRYRGVNRPARDGWETLTTLASVLEQHKPGFLEKLARHGSPKRKRPRAVRQNDPLLQSEASGPSYRPVEGHADWLLLVHGSTRSKLRWMRQMTEMAGLGWESDVEPIFENLST